LINALPLGPWSGGRHNDLVRTVLKISSPQFFSEEQHVQNLKKWNPEALITFPALLSKLYYYMLEKGHDPQREFSNLEKVFIAGEMSSRGFREKIGAFLQAEIIDTYACSELAILAIENKDKNGLITYADRFKIEIVDPHTNQPIAEGQGKILITDLKAEAKPIIRYDLGDLAEVYGLEEGYLKMSYIQGRTSEEISVGPAEFTRRDLEETLGRHPSLSKFYKVFIIEQEDGRKRLEIHGMLAEELSDEKKGELEQEIKTEVGRISSTMKVVVEETQYIHQPQISLYTSKDFPFKEVFQPKAKIIEYKNAT
ncbi:MAG: hypothetical protein ABIA37_01790, partial [Candidatus Woesearchaeota archaeon]